MPVSKQFYYQVMGEEFGPLTGIELRARAVAGDVTLETPVRIGADGEWGPAARLRNLFDETGRAISHEKIAQTLLNASVFQETPEEATPRGRVPSPLLLDAISFAARIHRGQTRKDGETPYVAHTFRVVAILATGFGVEDSEVLAAAALHGAIEDTTADLDELVEHFGERVAQYVALLSKDNRLPDKEREKDYLEHFAEADVGVKLCKLADVYDNLLDSSSLPNKTRMRIIRRASQIVERFSPDFPDQWSHALDLVRKLIEDTSGGLVRHTDKTEKPSEAAGA